MLSTIKTNDHGRPVRLDQFLRESCGVGMAFGLRTRQFAQTARWLGGYLHAAAILAQIPGGAAYKRMDDQRLDFTEEIWVPRREPAMRLLAEVLQRLEVKDLIEQVELGNPRMKITSEAREPSGARKDRSVSRAIKARLDGLESAGLVQVAVDCLDRLLVAPTLPEMTRYRDKQE